MASKLHHLNELANVLSDKEKTHEGVLAFYHQFKVSRLLSPFNAIKSKGYLVSTLILTLIMYRLRGASVWAMQKTGTLALFHGDENTIYRLMNNPLMNWRKLLMSFAKQFAVKVETKSVATSVKSCFIVDDTDLEKTGKTMEFISRIHDHVAQKFPLGFKMLTLGFWEGKSLIAVDFSLHREKRKDGTFGLSKKERSNQFHKKREKSLPSAMRVKELDEKKTEVAISMIKRAVKNGLVASYVLMDSWFTNDYMIKSVRSIKNGFCLKNANNTCAWEPAKIPILTDKSPTLPLF
ncbi:MAG: transposase [Bacteroidales bacterium]|jgi:hypothetical protein